jgi:uncharacterized protein (DUF169 family)
MTGNDGAAQWRRLSERLTAALHLAEPPIYLAFSGDRPPRLAAFDEPMSEPAPDGRTGRVSASCVFWVKAGANGGFSTVAEDHGNCSVGLYTHGFAGLEDVAGNDDVAALLSSGWVTEEVVPQIPAVRERPGSISYGRLSDAAAEPDVVLLRVNGRQMMVLSDALPGLRIEGKPQCHIVALAKNGEPAASVGCALSRARTGFRPEEMTCALPAGQLGELVDAIEQTAATDSVVAKYAAEDARRFRT